jgi:type II protein arginine methyltransferase
VQQELSWATHIATSAILMPLADSSCANLAGTILTYLASAHFAQVEIIDQARVSGSQHPSLSVVNHIVRFLFIQLWIKVPLTASSETDTWEWWNTLRMLCSQHQRVSVALDITADLPEEGALLRWLGEPLRAIVINTRFLSNL